MTFIEQFDRAERRRNVAFFVAFHVAMAAEALAALLIFGPSILHAVCR